MKHLFMNYWEMPIDFYLEFNMHYSMRINVVMVWFSILQDNKDARHVKTYEVALKDKDFVEGPWSQNNLDNGAGLLIPVPMPLGGVIIIGEETIVYCSGTSFKAIPIRPVNIMSLLSFLPSPPHSLTRLVFALIRSTGKYNYYSRC